MIRDWFKTYLKRVFAAICVSAVAGAFMLVCKANGLDIPKIISEIVLGTQRSADFGWIALLSLIAIAAAVGWYGEPRFERLLRLVSPTVEDGKWLGIVEAVEVFADPEIKGYREEARLNHARANEAARMKDIELTALQNQQWRGPAGPIQPSWPDEMVRVNDELKERNAVLISAIERLQRDETAIQADIHRKLRDGVLVARGYRVPVQTELPQIIPKEQWRILLLSAPDSAVGEGLRYTGVEVGRAANYRAPRPKNAPRQAAAKAL